jgi:hypothetical protein
MSRSSLDVAASAPRSCPAFAGEQAEIGAAGRREQVLLWLRGLAGIGRALAAQLSVVGLRQSQEPSIAHVDLNVAWLLLARAMRWTRALQARLGAAARAANARIEPVGRRLDPPAANENASSKGKAARQPEPDDGVGRIDGKPTVEIVEQICADLGAVGTLLGIADAERQLAMVAAQARAMLLGDGAQGGGVQTSAPPVVSGARHGAPMEPDKPEVVTTAAAVTQLRVPDTG